MAKNNFTKSLLQDTVRRATGAPLLKKFNVNSSLTQAIYRKPKDIKKSVIASVKNKSLFKYKQLTNAAFNGKLTVNKAKEIIFGSRSVSFKNIFNKNSLISTFSYGYAGGLNSTVPENQLIKISASSESNYGTIFAPLQKELITSIKSTWQPFIPDINQLAEVVSQTVFGKSLNNPITSRRMWMGTSPLRISLELNFVAINDAKREVEDACNVLQRLVCPSVAGKFLKYTFLNPPGPNPVDPSKGDQIMIQIGNMLTLKQVIISEVTVRKDNKLDENGYSTSATAILEIETYEILTKEKFTEATNMLTDPATAFIEGNGKATKAVIKVPNG